MLLPRAISLGQLIAINTGEQFSIRRVLVIHDAGLLVGEVLGIGYVADETLAAAMVVVTEDPDGCIDMITRVVEDSTEKCIVGDIEREDDGTATIEYLVGLPKDTEGTDIIATLRRLAGQCVLAAQYRNLKIEKAKDAGSTYWTFE